MQTKNRCFVIISNAVDLCAVIGIIVVGDTADGSDLFGTSVSKQRLKR